MGATTNNIACSMLAILLFVKTSEARIGRDDCPKPENFGSFLPGKPAETLDDCIWDSMTCMRSNSDACCQERFEACCASIMNPTTPAPPPPTEPPTRATCPLSNRLIDCIWNFNGCIEHKRMSESDCRSCFEDCKMVAMGMAPMGDSEDTTTQAPAPRKTPVNTWVQHPVQSFGQPRPSFGYQQGRQIPVAPAVRYFRPVPGIMRRPVYGF